MNHNAASSFVNGGRTGSGKLSQKSNSKSKKPRSHIVFITGVVVLVILILTLSIYVYFRSMKPVDAASITGQNTQGGSSNGHLPTIFQNAPEVAHTQVVENAKEVNTARTSSASTPRAPFPSTPRGQTNMRGSSTQTQKSKGSASFDCNDPVWCTISMPSHSHFKFPPPTDLAKWKEAQYLASMGEQVLLKRIVKVFGNPYEYLDGDRSFRGLQKIVDVFIDAKTGLDPLLGNRQDTIFSPIRRKMSEDEDEEEKEEDTSSIGTTANGNSNSNILETSSTSTISPERGSHRALADRLMSRFALSPDSPKSNSQTFGEPETTKALSVNGQQIVPFPYNFRLSDRAPVVEMGYTAFMKNQNTYFSGNFIGGNFVKREWFFGEWNKVKDDIDTPFITMCALNENWGLLSTNFPNRTAGWGACCNKPSQRNVWEFLNHDKTLMLIINQHSNISHPKLLTIPRGLPLTWEHTNKVVWDSQRHIAATFKKKKLLFAASSSWGKRPQILRCISNKMSLADFEGHSDTPPAEMAKMKVDRRHYYEKLGQARFGVALPGLGYDCFRTWELLTMGTIVVIERGVGLDRTLWRLPALLLEDFDEITPQLLREAYVEAIYRADDFEFERLKESFWLDVIANVSHSKSTQPLLDAFPMEAEEKGFARPKVPYECGKTGTCGKGAKRIPKNSC